MALQPSSRAHLTTLWIDVNAEAAASLDRNLKNIVDSAARVVQTATKSLGGINDSFNEGKRISEMFARQIGEAFRAAQEGGVRTAEEFEKFREEALRNIDTIDQLGRSVKADTTAFDQLRRVVENAEYTQKEYSKTVAMTDDAIDANTAKIKQMYDAARTTRNMWAGRIIGDQEFIQSSQQTRQELLEFMRTTELTSDQTRQLTQGLAFLQRGLDSASGVASRGGLAWTTQIGLMNQFGTSVKALSPELTRMTGGLGIAATGLMGLGEGVDFSAAGILKLGRNITTILPLLTAIGTVAAGAALLKMGFDAVKAADDLVNAAQKMSVSIEAAQEFQHVAEATGVSVDVMATAIDRLERRASRSGVQDAFKQLGVAVHDANGELRRAEDLFTDVADRLGRMENETERAGLAFQIFSRDASALTSVFEVGADGISALRQEARDLGLVISGDTVLSLHEFSSEIATMKRQFAASRTEIAAAFLPVMRVGMQFLQDVAVPALQGVAEKVTEFAGKFTDASDKGAAFRADLAKTLRPLIVLGEIAGLVGNVVVLAFQAISDSVVFMANKVSADILKIRKLYEDFMGFVTGKPEFKSEAVIIGEGEDMQILLFTPTEKAIYEHERAMEQASGNLARNFGAFFEKTLARIERVMDPDAYDKIFEPFVESLGEVGEQGGVAMALELEEGLTEGLAGVRVALEGSLAYAREQLRAAQEEFNHAITLADRETAHADILFWEDRIKEIENAFRAAGEAIDNWADLQVKAGQELIKNQERAAALRGEIADTHPALEALLAGYRAQLTSLEEGSRAWATIADEILRIEDILNDIEPVKLFEDIPQSLIDIVTAATPGLEERDTGRRAPPQQDMAHVMSVELHRMIREGEDAARIFAHLQELLVLRPMTMQQLSEFTRGWSDANIELFVAAGMARDLTPSIGLVTTAAEDLNDELGYLARVAAALSEPFDVFGAEIQTVERRIKELMSATGELTTSQQADLAWLQARLAALRELDAAEVARLETMALTERQTNSFAAAFTEINQIGRDSLDVFDQWEVSLALMRDAGELTADAYHALMNEVAKARDRVADIKALEQAEKDAAKSAEEAARAREGLQSSYEAALNGVRTALGLNMTQTEAWAATAREAYLEMIIDAEEYAKILEYIAELQERDLTSAADAARSKTLSVVNDIVGAFNRFQSTLRETGREFEAVFQAFFDIGGAVGDFIAPGLGEVISTVGNVFMSIIGDMSNGIAQVQEQVQGAVNSANLISKSVVEALGSAHTSQVSRGGLLGLLGFTKAELNNEGFRAALAIAEGLAGNLASAMKAQDFSKAFDDMITNLMVDAMIKTALAAPAVQDAILRATEAIERGDAAAAASIMRGVKSELAGTANAISQMLHTDVVQPVTATFRSQFADSLEGAFQSAFSSADITSGLTQLGNSVKDILRNAVIRGFLEATAMQSLTQKLGEEIEWVVQQALSGDSMRDLVMTMRKEQVQLSREVSAARERYEESPTAANREAVADLEAQLERMTARIMPMFEKLQIDPNAVMDVDMSGLENVTEEWKAQWEMLSDILADLGLGFETLNDSVVDMTASMQNVPPIFKDITRSFDSVVGDYGFTGTTATVAGDTNVTIVVNAPIYGVEDLEGTIRDTYIDIERERGLSGRGLPK